MKIGRIGCVGAVLALVACGAPADSDAAGEAAATGTAAESGAVARGDYECWANGAARMLMNFTVTGNGRYQANDGSTGSFDYDAGSGVIVFTGYMRDIMLDTWTTYYHEMDGVPTVSFVSDRGAEAAFCQNVP